MKYIVQLFCCLMLITSPGLASCQNNSANIKQAMQAEFQLFYDALKVHDFSKATSFVSPDLIKAMLSSEGQMKVLLAANFGNDTFLNIQHRLLTLTTDVPNAIVDRDGKSYAVIHAVIEMQLIFDLKDEDVAEAEEDIDILKSLVAATYGDRMEIGTVSQKDGKAILNMKESRLVAAIYDPATNKTTFALSEKFMKSFYDDFLPPAIISEMAEQL